MVFANRRRLPELIAEAAQSRLLPRQPNKATVGNDSTLGQVIGHDVLNGRLFRVISTGPALYETLEDGSSATSNRTLPAGLTSWDYARKVVRFGAHLYLMGVSDELITIWRTSPNYSNSAATYTWTQVHQCSTGANAAIGGTFNTDGTYLYLGEYGDPTGGPSIWRSSDGTTWSRVVGPLASTRHIHCVAADPYTPGHVWATLGDGGPRLVMRSLDYGTTWSVTVSNSLGTWPQAVQISFDPDWVWFAADQVDNSVWVMDRIEQVPRIASENYHGDYPVPGAVGRATFHFTDGVFTAASKTVTSDTAAFVAGDVGRIVQSNRLPDKNVYIASVESETSVTLSDNAALSGTGRAFFLGGQRFADNLMMGLIDPTNNVYYGHAHSASNNEEVWQDGMFVMKGGPGQRLELYQRLQSINGMPPYEVFLTTSYVWVGRWRFPRFVA